MSGVVAPASPMGGELRLVAGDYEAAVVEVGAGVRGLWHRGRALLDDYPADVPCDGSRGQLLVPWPNRVDRGRYELGGETRQLDLTEPERDCAIHGLARWQTWQVRETATDRAALALRLHAQPGYPHVLDLLAEYRLDAEGGLVTRVTATNAGATAAPYAVGSHPYLTAGTARIDECELVVPAALRLPTDMRGIPTGREAVAGTPYDFREPRRLGELFLDYAFTDLQRDEHGIATLTLRDPGSGRGASLWVDGAYRWLELFTGDTLERGPRTALGVEPMSCAPNGFVSGDGVAVLDPGATHVATWGVCALEPH